VRQGLIVFAATVAVPAVAFIFAAGTAILVPPIGPVVALLVAFTGGALIRRNVVRSRPWIAPITDSSGPRRITPMSPGPVPLANHGKGEG
jgi:hypothetical protein